VVHHDANMRDGRAIDEHDLSRLRRGPDRHEMPTLREVLALVSSKAEVFVELKGAGIERHVLDVLAGFRGSAAIHSFDHMAIRRLSNLECRWRLGVLTEDEVADPAALLRGTGAKDYWPEESLVTGELVSTVVAVGGRVIAWTVNDAKRMRELAAMHVSGICTDDVGALALALRPS